MKSNFYLSNFKLNQLAAGARRAANLVQKKGVSHMNKFHRPGSGTQIRTRHLGVKVPCFTS